MGSQAPARRRSNRRSRRRRAAQARGGRTRCRRTGVALRVPRHSADRQPPRCGGSRRFARVRRPRGAGPATPAASARAPHPLWRWAPAEPWPTRRRAETAAMNRSSAADRSLAFHSSAGATPSPPGGAPTSLLALLQLSVTRAFRRPLGTTQSSESGSGFPVADRAAGSDSLLWRVVWLT